MTDSSDRVGTRLSRTGLRLTELGLGGAQFGNLYHARSDSEVHDAFERAWADGLRHIDTAPHYGLGLSESRLGAALAGRPRDEYVISTKVGRLLIPRPNGQVEADDGFVVTSPLIRRWDMSARGVRASLEASLDRLGTGYVDVLYVHDPDNFEKEAASEAIPELLRMREAGIVREIGVAMNQTAMVQRFIESFDIDIVMVAGRFTLLDAGAIESLLPAAIERGVSVVIAGVYNSGLLSKDVVNSSGKFDYQPASKNVVDKAREIAAICERHGTTLPTAAIAYPLLHPSVVSIVVGAGSAREVASNSERYHSPIPESLWRELSAKGLVSFDFGGAGRQWA